MGGNPKLSTIWNLSLQNSAKFTLFWKKESMCDQAAPVLTVPKTLVSKCV